MYLVSACLAGFPCRYDGKDNAHPSVEQLLREGKAIPVCPEQLGGMTTPRACSEQCGNGVVNTKGETVTEAFEHGARATLVLAKKYNCTCAIMKAKSPSCGTTHIYDGTFSGKLIPGEGITVRLLREHGIQVMSETDIAMHSLE